MTKTKKITVSALLVAMATVLSLVSKAIPAPWLQGGSVTIASMVPIIAVSLIIDSRWGVLSAIVYSLIQMLTGFYPPPVQTVGYFFLVIFLDYVAAFGVLGCAGWFYRLWDEKSFAIPLSGAIVTLGRYICHILSGILIWGVYAPEGQSVLAYSLIYNGTYMIPEIIITAVVLGAITPVIRKIR